MSYSEKLSLVNNDIARLRTTAAEYGRYVSRGKYSQSDRVRRYEAGRLTDRMHERSPEDVRHLGETLLVRTLTEGSLFLDVHHRGFDPELPYTQEIYSDEDADGFVTVDNVYAAKVALARFVKINDAHTFEFARPDADYLFTTENRRLHLTFDAIAVQVARNGHDHCEFTPAYAVRAIK